MWHDIAALLPDADSVMVDLPGQGDTGGQWRGFEHAADQVATLIAAVAGGRPVHLAALSLGSYVGLSLLAKHPTLCASALLSGMQGGDLPYKPLCKVWSYLIAPVAGTAFFARITARQIDAKEERVSQFIVEAGKTTVQAYRQAAIDVVDFTVPDNLNLVQTPTIMAAGSEEPACVLTGQHAIADSLKNGKAVVNEGGDHFWPGKKPDEFAAILQKQIDCDKAQS